jgi:hypothetical protein
LKAGTLSVNQSLERIRGKVTFKTPKPKTSRRSITLPALTVQALQEYHAAQAEERLKRGFGRDSRGLVDGRCKREGRQRAGRSCQREHHSVGLRRLYSEHTG